MNSSKVSLAKHNENLQLNDDYDRNRKDTDDDINKETENMLSLFTEDEIKEYKQPMLTENNPSTQSLVLI